MATWKKVLTEEDGNLATADQTITSGESRNVTLASNTLFTLKTSNVDGSFDNGALFVMTDSVSSGSLDTITLQADQTRLRVTGASDSVSGSLSFKEADNNGNNLITLAAPTSLSANETFVLPASDGTNGQALITDGSGNLSFSTVSGGSDTHLGNADLTADDNRTYDQDGNDLRFDPSGGVFSVDDSSGSPSLPELEIGQGTVSLRANSGSMRIQGLRYPDSDGTNGQALTTNGSGTLSFTTVGGVTINDNTDNYLLTASGTANTINGESNLQWVQNSLQVSGSIEYQPDAYVRRGEVYDATEQGPYMDASGNSAGDIMLWLKNGSVTNFKVHTMNSAGAPELLDASSSSTNISQIAGITVVTVSSTSAFYIRGLVSVPETSVNGTFSNSYGDPLYLDPSNAGVLTIDAPTASGVYRRHMGYVINRSLISSVQHYLIWFDPSPEYVKIA